MTLSTSSRSRALLPVYGTMGIVAGSACAWLHHAELVAFAIQQSGTSEDAGWFFPLLSGSGVLAVFVLLGFLHSILRELRSRRRQPDAKLASAPDVDGHALAYGGPPRSYPEDQPNHEKNIVPDFD